MLVRFNKRTIVGGTTYSPEDGDVDLANDLADQVVAEGNGVVVGLGDYSNEARFATDASGNVIGLLGAGGSVLFGQMVSGVWMKVPSIFRLRLTGTGAVTIDSKDSLGNITTGVASYTVTGATDQIEFPYAGDKAVAIRATLTGTATAEVI